jgi:hypothetical protein
MASGTPAPFVGAVLERVESSRAKPTARRGVAAMDLQNGKEYRAIAQVRRRLGLMESSCMRGSCANGSMLLGTFHHHRRSVARVVLGRSSTPARA